MRALWVIAALCATAPAMAAIPGEADRSKAASLSVSRSVVAGGGGIARHGRFSLRGTVAQADADPLMPSRGGRFQLTGGFWAGGKPAAEGGVIFADSFER